MHLAEMSLPTVSGLAYVYQYTLLCRYWFWALNWAIASKFDGWVVFLTKSIISQ